jgi:hypothetical protein
MSNRNKDIYNLFDILKSKGRHGDTELAHITKDEARLLKSLGGAGTINPDTGLKEYHGSLTGYNLWGKKKPPAGHPFHHNETVQDIYGTVTDFVEDKTDIDTGLLDDTLGIDTRTSEQKWYDEHYEGDGHNHPGTWNPDGTYTPAPYEPEPITPGKEVKYEEISKYVNQETGEITDIDGLMAYYRTINPELSDVGDFELKSRIKEGPSLITDASKRQDIYSGFQEGLSDLRTGLKEEKLKAKSLAGTTGITRPGMLDFGGVDKKISEGFYQDYSGLGRQYESDIYGLAGGVEKEVVDFLFPN